MMKKLGLIMLVLTVGVVVASTNSYAFPMTGVVNYSAPSWTGSVNWELYAPGDSNSYLPADSNWHYFFYVTNNSTSSSEIALFSVGNVSKAPIVSSGWLDRAAGTVQPKETSHSGSSIKYYFGYPSWAGPGNDPYWVMPGQSTEWVYFTSPYAPQWVSGGLQNGDNDYQPVPGPVPEPTSMTLLGLGLIGLAGRAIKRFKA